MNTIINVNIKQEVALIGHLFFVYFYYIMADHQQFGVAFVKRMHMLGDSFGIKHHRKAASRNETQPHISDEHINHLNW